MADPNPYAPPAPVRDQEGESRRLVIDRLRGPALGLLIMSIPYGTFAVFALTFLAIVEAGRALGWLPWNIADTGDIFQAATALAS